MPRLALVPPLPPEPPVEVARGQHAFEFLEVFVVAKASRPHPKRRKRRRQPRQAKKSGRWQYAFLFERRVRPRPPRKRRTKKLESTRLRIRERVEMLQDIRALEQEGAYPSRPRHGNGVAGDCPTGPCPFASCRHSLLVTIRRSGSVKRTWPNLDVDQVRETCSLRVAAQQAAKGEDEPMSFSDIGAVMNMTAQRAEQINAVAERKLVAAWLEMYPDDPPPRFRKG